MASLMIFLSLEGYYYCSSQQQNLYQPIAVPPILIKDGLCPSQEHIEEQINMIKSNILNRYRPPCACGGSGEWSRIAHLNMNDTSQDCPSNWTLHETPVRGCAKTETTSSDSAFFSSNGRTYSHVCGRIIAYQKGSPHAFLHTINGVQVGLERQYIAGISLTHGEAGSREHIWSFVSTYNEHDTDTWLNWKCSCVDNTYNWPYTTPSFVGNDYFCDSGNHGPAWSYTAYYPNNALWDGDGCGPTSTCCEFNSPPWFYKTLPQPTSDDIEVRNSGQGSDEDCIVQLVEIYIK